MLRILLFPISKLWDLIYKIRRHLFHIGVFKSTSFSVPVISVGNLSFGGTGKTPMVIWLIDYLEEQNIKSMIVTRGYKSKSEKGSALLNNDVNSTNEKLTDIFGDEPTMISHHQKDKAIAVGRNRTKNIYKYFTEVSPDVIILDDGFQHLKIQRSVDIVLFDANLPIEKYYTAPVGYLREGTSALKYVDIAIITRCNQVSDVKIERIKELLRKNANQKLIILESQMKYAGIFNIDYSFNCSTQEMNQEEVLLVTAVANPDNVIQSLKDLKIKVAHVERFSDHYQYSQQDLNKFINISTEKNLKIITTEKDIVKIAELDHQDKFLFLKVTLDMPHDDILKKYLNTQIF